MRIPTPALSTAAALNLQPYRTLYLIRSAEAGIRKYYDEDGMKTPMHMSQDSKWKAGNDGFRSTCFGIAITRRE